MNSTKKLTLASMLLAIGIILPQAFHSIPNAGIIFLPMHIPVLICGYICGPLFGILVGIITPVISNIIFGMPVTLMLGQMCIELGMYGLSSGILNNILKIKNEIVKNYIVLIVSMIIGRVVYGICNALILKAGNYSLEIWLTSAFISALPGIIIQIVFIPVLVKNIKKIL